jgi:tetratricopeptide (TPR) repeat protein
MHRSVVPFALLMAAPVLAAPASAAEIRSAEECRLAVAADAPSAREAASVWKRLGGGTEAELCEAEALEAMGAFRSAASILTRLGENPKRALPLALRTSVLEDAARLWLADGRPDLARQGLANLARVTEPTPSQLMLAARAEAGLGQWNASAATLATLIAAEPQNAEAHALRAAALRLGGDPAGAAAEADKALALDPDLAPARFEAAAAAAEGGDRLQAEAIWTRLIRAHPDHPLATSARRNLAGVPSAAPEPIPPHPGPPRPRP